ncbi:CoA transferase [Rhodococcus sp. NPDC059968]|uniref:CoA transferase n=1 Tax=Rhodococcus sp. NPDC059968 TaxID=3347017 RepID=UPI003670D6E0
MTARADSPTPAGFLSRYRVLDLTDERGLLAGAMFGRLGAHVIQVEPPGGSSARQVPPFSNNVGPLEHSAHSSLFWSAYASGKRGITCSLDSAAGRALVQRLAASADVVFESFGAAIHPDLRYEALRELNPRLIHVTISAFGSDGPKSSYEDTELIAWAAAGPLWPHRDERGTPLRVSAPQAYLHAAADAASGAMLALLARERTGRGQHVDVSAQESASLATMSATFATAVGHNNYSFDSPSLTEDPEDRGAHRRRSKWRALDGWVQMHIGMGPTDGRFANLLFNWIRREGELPAGVADWDWIKLPELLRDGRVSQEQVEQARAAVAACLARRTKREILDVAVSERILMAPALTVAEVRESPHFNQRGLFEAVDENGVERTLPGRLAATSVPGHGVLKPAPLLGEHNQEIYLGLLGLAPEELTQLEQEGVV